MRTAGAGIQPFRGGEASMTWATRLGPSRAPNTSRGLALSGFLLAASACSGMEDGSSSASPEQSTANAHTPAKPNPGDSMSVPMPAVPKGAPGSGSVGPLPPNTSWARESMHPITWTTPRDLPLLDDAVMFEESQDAGATWTFVRNVQAAEEYYRYSVPATGPARVRLRLTFGRTDGRGYYTPLRSFQTLDVPLTASQKKAYAWTKVANDILRFKQPPRWAEA